MTFGWLALKGIVALAGVWYLGRAVIRRFRVRDDARVRDPALTRGLQILGCAGLAFAVGALAVPLRLVYGWPPWVRVAGDGIVVATMIVMFPLAAWLGWRIHREEFEDLGRAGSETLRDQDQVT